MTPAIGTLLWWNRTPDAAALFWHGAAGSARRIAVDELGDACRIEAIPAAGVRMTSLLPPELSYLEHGGQPARLRPGLARVLDGARAWRVLAVGAIDSAALFDVALDVFRPDVVAGPGGVDQWRCDVALRPVLRAWLAAFEAGATRRATARRYRIDELIVDGPVPPGPAASLRIAPGRRVGLLLPGCAGGSLSVRLDLQAAASRDVWLRLDGRELDARRVGDRIEAVATGLAAASCRTLDIGHAAAAELAVAGVSIGPA